VGCADDVDRPRLATHVGVEYSLNDSASSNSGEGIIFGLRFGNQRGRHHLHYSGDQDYSKQTRNSRFHFNLLRETDFLWAP
jgi:hypothetical protein